MRNFNSSSIELLAPASNYDFVDLLLQSGCDAIYLGGKDFNMRMHSDKLNFSITEIRKTGIK